jgi:hypothetical protein
MVPTHTAIMNETNDKHGFYGIMVSDQENEMGEDRNQGIEAGNEVSREEEMDLDEEMQREMEELAQLQEQWGNPSFIGRHQIHAPIEDSSPAPPPLESTPLMSTLLIAQHEWRKVLDGAKGQTPGRPILPLTDAVANVYWGDEFFGYIFKMSTGSLSIAGGGTI